MMRLPDPSLPWPIIKEGVFLCAQREQCRNVTYLDWPGKKPTKGWGETSGVAIGDTPWTDAECDQRFVVALTERANAVRAMCKVPPTAHQLAGLVVCAYNIGVPALRGSSMMKAHNRGDFLAAARAFLLWNKATDAATGKLIVVEELVGRRHAEAALYLTPDVGTMQYPVPQTVVPPPAVAASPTVQTSTAAVVVGSLTAASPFFEKLHDLGNHFTAIAADFGLTPVQVLGAVLLIVGGLVLYRRLSQHRAGIA